MKRLCDENCNECSLLEDTRSNRELTLILNKAYDKFGDEFYKLVNDNCPNLTCCVRCNIDDFCHDEGCPIYHLSKQTVMENEK